RNIDLGNARGFPRGRDDAAAVAPLQGLDPGGVIAMMVRHQDLVEPPAGLGQGGFHRTRLRRVDCRRRAAYGIVQQNAVVVAQTREKPQFHRHWQDLVKGRNASMAPRRDVSLRRSVANDWPARPFTVAIARSCRSMSSICATFTASRWARWRGGSSAAAYGHAGGTSM